MNELERIDRYLAIAEWARRRYTEMVPVTLRNGVIGVEPRLITHVGGELSVYSRIEEAAFHSYVADCGARMVR